MHFIASRPVLETSPLEPARAKCTLKLQGHNARRQSARARSSQMQKCQPAGAAAPRAALDGPTVGPDEAVYGPIRVADHPY
jgi:hypothetical protein